MATTYNWTDNSIRGAEKPNNTTPSGFEVFCLRNKVDTALQNVAANVSIIQALNVPANTTVLMVYVRTITANAGSPDSDIGVTTTDPNQWGEAIDLSSAPAVLGGSLITAAPRYFPTADTIDVVNQSGAALAASVFEIVAICVRGSNTIDGGGQLYAAQS